MPEEKIMIIYSEIFMKYPEIVFGFSTKQGGISPPPYYLNLSASVGDEISNVNRNRDIFFNELGFDASDVSLMKQVHSSNVEYTGSPQLVMDSDAIFTDKKNIYLAVSVADCIPVFLFEPEREIIAVIHAGWKGTSEKIVEKCIDKMVEECKVDPAKLIAYIGPGISQENYEVGEEVGKFFNDDVKKSGNGKYYIDLKKENVNQLLSKGVKEENIEVSPYCTFKDEELFHSHRRENGKTGRMFGVIGMKE
jgi:YfiH family protein